MAKKMLTSGRVIAKEKKKIRQNVQTDQLLTLEATELKWATQKKLEFHSTIDD
jgi:FtsZ-binding cell division protein ZapB